MVTFQRRQPRAAPSSIGIWGHYYGANLGDELVTHVVAQAIRARLPHAEIHAFSLDPQDSRARHGLPATPISARPPENHPERAPRPRPSGWRRIALGLWRRARGVLREGPHLWHGYRALRRVDLLIVAGSGQLLDSWSGPWGHPYTAWKWAMLARLAGTRLAFLSVGAGPIQHPLSRWFVRSAVQRAEYVSVRDQASARELRSAGVRQALPVVPDMAFGLAQEELPVVGPHRDRWVVGVNPMAHASAHYWGRGDETLYRAYVEKVAQLVRALVEEDADVVLFSSQVRADPLTAHDVLEHLDAQGGVPAGRVAVHPVQSVQDLLRTVAGCDEVIGARYHCVLTPLMLGVPTLALAYHPKTVHLMAMAGQGDYCLDIDAFEPEHLLARHHRLRQHHDLVREALLGAMPALRAAVDEQFDHVLSDRRPVPMKEPALS